MSCRLRLRVSNQNPFLSCNHSIYLVQIGGDHCAAFADETPIFQYLGDGFWISTAAIVTRGFDLDFTELIVGGIIRIFRHLRFGLSEFSRRLFYNIAATFYHHFQTLLRLNRLCHSQIEEIASPSLSSI